jgi:hypothetical protein
MTPSARGVAPATKISCRAVCVRRTRNRSALPRALGLALVVAERLDDAARHVARITALAQARFRATEPTGSLKASIAWRAQRGMIVIKTPDAATFPDQDFRPVK